MFSSSVKKEDITSELDSIHYPDTKQSLVNLGMVREVEIDGSNVNIQLATPTPDRKVQIGLESQIRTLLKNKYAQIEKLKVKFSTDPSLQDAINDRLPNVKNIVAIASGKGGVGKSTVTVNLAAAMSALGYKVGILDADIYGPSIGKMFGYGGKIPLKAKADNIIDPEERFGIKLISFGFLLNEGQPVVWRGPMLGKALEQFLFDINWGELDFLFIDMPPGTGDTQLSLAQLVEMNGAVIVSTPQSVATLDAARAATAMGQLKIPILGVIENMGEFICPECGTVSHIFSQGGGEMFAKQTGAPLLGSLPLNSDFMHAGESGDILPLKYPKGEGAPAHVKPFFDIAAELLKEKDWLNLD